MKLSDFVSLPGTLVITLSFRKHYTKGKIHLYVQPQYTLMSILANFSSYEQ